MLSAQACSSCYVSFPLLTSLFAILECVCVFCSVGGAWLIFEAKPPYRCRVAAAETHNRKASPSSSSSSSAARRVWKREREPQADVRKQKLHTDAVSDATASILTWLCVYYVSAPLSAGVPTPFSPNPRPPPEAEKTLSLSSSVTSSYQLSPSVSFFCCLFVLNHWSSLAPLQFPAPREN